MAIDGDHVSVAHATRVQGELEVCEAVCFQRASAGLRAASAGLRAAGAVRARLTDNEPRRCTAASPPPRAARPCSASRASRSW